MMGLFIPNMQKPKKGEVIAFDGEYAVYTDDDMQVRRYSLIEIDLVRCEKCKKSKLYTMNSNLPISRWCHRFSVPVAVEDDDYCSYAERRNDERITE